MCIFQKTSCAWIGPIYHCHYLSYLQRIFLDANHVTIGMRTISRMHNQFWTFLISKATMIQIVSHMVWYLTQDLFMLYICQKKSSVVQNCLSSKSITAEVISWVPPKFTVCLIVQVCMFGLFFECLWWLFALCRHHIHELYTNFCSYFLTFHKLIHVKT